MKNIFKEYKKLKVENLHLKFENERLREDNNEANLRILEFEKLKYNTKMKRKKEVEKICKNLERKLNSNITSLIDLDITTDINAYLKLLEYLKEE